MAAKRRLTRPAQEEEEVVVKEGEVMMMSNVRKAKEDHRHGTKHHRTADIGNDDSTWSLFLVLLAIRALDAALTQTFFQPDEYFQSLEIAHQIVFGYGFRTWEWRVPATTASKITTSAPTSWSDGPLRSVAHPALFVPVYWLLKTLKLDRTALLTLAPRLFQAFFAAVGDLYTCKLARRMLGFEGACSTLFATLVSLYGFYTSTRTFSNSLEVVLTVVALYYWPLSASHDVDDAPPVSCKRPERRVERRSFRYALGAAAAACVIRPTNVVLWIFLGPKYMLSRVRAVSSGTDAIILLLELRDVAIDVLLIAFTALALTIGLDTAYYGRLTFTPLAFFERNVLHSVSLFYGANPWHWYLSQGLPVLCFTALPYTAVGWWRAVRNPASGAAPAVQKAGKKTIDHEALRTLAQLAAWTVSIYSLLGHKEFRFLQPILPVLHIFTGYAFILLSSNLSASSDRPARSRSDSPRAILSILSTWRALPRRHTLFQLATHLPLSLYLVHFHCRAQVGIMSHLGDLVDTGELRSVGFLMPCHSTPWQSHLHRAELELEPDLGLADEEWGAGKDEQNGREAGRRRNGSGEDGRAWFITCAPPSRSQSPSTYKDQSDFFYADPFTYLTERFPKHVDPNFPPSPPSQVLERFSENGNVNKELDEHDLGWIHTWPSHLVLFSNLLEKLQSHPSRSHPEATRTISQLLLEKGYVERTRLWNAFFHEDSRRAGDVVVLRWQGQAGSALVR